MKHILIALTLVSTVQFTIAQEKLTREEALPYAKAVSAKSYDFDESGNENKIDYPRMLKIVKDAGYRGWIGIEYEGGNGDSEMLLSTWGSCHGTGACLRG